MSDSNQKYFFIKSKLNGMVLDVFEGNPDPHTKVITYPQRRTENRNQLWYTHPPTHTIRSVANGLCLQINANNRLEINTYKETNNSQQWTLTGHRVCNKHDQTTVLDVVEGNRAACGDICAYKDHGGHNQLWEFEYISSEQLQQYFIVTRLNGLVLGVDKDNPEPGCKVTTCHQSYLHNLHQLWYTEQGTVRNAATHLCLELNDNNRLIINQFKQDNTNQQWIFNGSAICKKDDESMVLDFVEGNQDPDTEICTHKLKGGNNQLWDFEYIEGNRAPSVHFHFNDNTPGDIIMIDAMIPKQGLANFTYYCMLNWNCGRNGGGYCGIQDHERGRNFIFSIWDPTDGTKEKIKAVYASPGTKVERFGGEGNGLKSWNFTLGWETDEWMTFVARRWDKNNKSYFGYWVHQQNQTKWTHLVTMEFPVPSIMFTTSTGCFIEDWMGNGKHPRCATYKNGHKRNLDGSWLTFSKCNFFAVLEDATSQHNNHYDARMSVDTYTLATGGNFQPSAGLNPKGTSMNFKDDERSKPKKDPIDFEITTVTNDKIEWLVTEGTTPSFSFSVVNDSTQELLTDIYPQQNHVLMKSPSGSAVTVTLEDILGNKITKTTVLSS